MDETQQQNRCERDTYGGPHQGPRAKSLLYDLDRVVIIGGSLVGGLVADLSFSCVIGGLHRGMAEHVDFSGYAVASPKQAFQGAALEDCRAAATLSAQFAFDVL